VDITETTQAASTQGHQERQLIAGRYRLGSFHRGDDTTEVWRALDQATQQVVSLEFLRDPNPASRERFVAGARRLESAPPSVMRVAGIHDGPDGTFIVFEHLVHIPVPVGWLELAVDAPAQTPNAPSVEASAVQTTATSRAELGGTPMSATPGTPEREMLIGANEPLIGANEPLIGANERPTDRGLSLLLYALRARELSLIDADVITDSAFELFSLFAAEVKAVRFDPTVFSDVFSFVRSADISAIASAPLRAAAGVGRIATIRPQVRMPGPRVSRPRPVRAPRVKAVAPPKHKEPRPASIPRAPRVWTGPRVRWGRVLFRGLSVGLIAAVLVTVPPEMLGNLANVAGEVGGNVATVATEVATGVGTAIGEKLASTQTSQLQRATFEVPPLSAYGAAFEAQAAYPTAHPNATVEWVVALRNTGSAGWYRGIDGAQASLALEDGTTAGVQTTQYVGPGQVGWFVVHFPAPSQTGAAKVHLLPRIDGRGRLADLGIYATVTVSPN
jgi:hypothetical protein